MAGKLIVRLGCYKVGSGEKVLRRGPRMAVAGEHLFRFRWVITDETADCCNPNLSELHMPKFNDAFTISFTPSNGVPPLVVTPKSDENLTATERIPRIEIARNVPGAKYGITIGVPEPGVRPPTWPNELVEVSVQGGASIEETRVALKDALNDWQPPAGSDKFWAAVDAGAKGIELQLANAAALGDVSLSASLDEVPITNASNPPNLVDLFDVTTPGLNRERKHTRPVKEFLAGCEEVDGFRVVKRAAGNLQAFLLKYFGREQMFGGETQFKAFCSEFTSGLYERFSNETTLEDILRDSRKDKASDFVQWLEPHIDRCCGAAQLDLKKLTDPARKMFKRGVTLAMRAAIRDIDASIQGKSAVALAVAAGTVTDHESGGQTSHSALAELCGTEVEFDATPFTANPAPGQTYQKVRVDIEWTNASGTVTRGMYPDEDRDCFNEASRPLTPPPVGKLVEDGFFVSRFDEQEKQPVFKSSAGEGVVSVQVANASAASFWPAFFVTYTDDAGPPDIDALIAAGKFPRLSVIDAKQAVIESPMQVGLRQFGPVHWQETVTAPFLIKNGKYEPVRKFVWLFARSTAGGWLPAIPVNRRTGIFGLKPPSLLGLASNEIAFLSSGTPIPAGVKDKALAASPIVNSSNFSLKVTVDSKREYYESFGIDELHLMVFRRPGDLPERLEQSGFADAAGSRTALSSDFDYYRATPWFNALTNAGWHPLPCLSVYRDPDLTKPELDFVYQDGSNQPVAVPPGWRYIGVVVGKRSQSLCYQVPRTAAETGGNPDASYFVALRYRKDGVMFNTDPLFAWRYLASGLHQGSQTLPVHLDKSIRFEYSEAAVTTETYIPSIAPADRIPILVQ